MKKYSLIKFASLIILLMVFQMSIAQTVNSPKTLTITMEIDYDSWNRDKKDLWYDHITFSDNDSIKNQDNGKKGRSFKSKVKRKQKLIWKAQILDDGEKSKNKEVVLISVSRNPGNGKDFLLSEFWYDGKYDKKNAEYIVEGAIRDMAIPEYLEERYTISFAIHYLDDDENVKFDIYTVDPIIRGHDN